MLKVSVIIPIFNAAEYLYICLDSIVNQTYKNIEIIVIDDKSTDLSVMLLKRYKQKYKNIKLIVSKKNQGVGHARNVGIKAATGDYLFFIDSDDSIDKDGIAKMVNLVEQYEADVVEAERLFWYRRNYKLLTFTEQKKLRNDFVLGNIHNDFRSITMPRYVTGKLYKRSVIGDVRFDEHIRCYEDSLFNHQIKANFTKYVYAKDVMYHYLQRPSSLINTIGTNHLDYLYVGQKIKKLYEQNNYYNLDIKSIVDNIIMSDIIAIICIKIPKMQLSIKVKMEYVEKFIGLNQKLSLTNIKLNYRLIIGLFKNKTFLSIYLKLTSHLNLIDIGFRVLSIIHGYYINDTRLKRKIMSLYSKMN